MKIALFTLALLHPSPSDPVGLQRSADLDADGRVDLVRVVDGRPSVAWNLGERAFEPAVELPVGDVRALLIEDLDGDGTLDLYAVTGAANVALVSDGARGFVDATRALGLEDDGVGLDVERLDADGDGLQDLLLHDAHGDVLFWGLAEGGFERDGPPVPAVTARLAAPPPASAVAPVVHVALTNTPAPTGEASSRRAIVSRERSNERARERAGAAGAGAAPSTSSGLAAFGATSLPGAPPGSLLLWDGATPPPGYESTGWTLQVDQTGGWSEEAPAPVAHHAAASAVVDGSLYVFGGWNGSQYVTSVAVYDSSTLTWTTRNPMPEGMAYAPTAVVDGKVLLFGGYDGSAYTTDVREYDPVTDSWTDRASLPAVQHRPGLGEVGGKVYLIGGYNGGGSSIALVREYDPATDTWTLRSTTLPLARYGSSSATVDGKIVVVGGYATSGAGYVPNVDVYDPASDAFTGGTPAPTPSFAGKAVVRAGRVVVTGIYDGQSYSARVDAYDPIADSWSAWPSMPSPHGYASAGVLDGRIHVVGGYNGSVPSAIHHVYDEPGPALAVVRKH